MSSRLNVLLVDDDADLSAALQEFLQDEGYDVTCCASRGSALKALASDVFHIVLTDLKLPDGDGLEVVKTAKAQDRGIVAAVMTGYASLETALKAIRLGAYDYVTKPFNFDEIEILIANMSDKVRLMDENRRIQDRLDILSRNFDDLSAVKVELGRLTRLLREGFEKLEKRFDQLEGGAEADVSKLPPFRG